MGENRKPRILLCRIGAIGDICMAMPLVKSLSEKYEVDWLIRKTNASLLDLFPNLRVNRILVNPTKTHWFDENTIDQLVKSQYDVLVDLSHWPEIEFLAKRLKSIPVRIRSLDPKQDALLGIPPLEDPTAFTHLIPVVKTHQTEKWVELIAKSLKLELPLLWEFPSSKKDSNAVFVHPHASKPNKRWSVENYAKLLEEIYRKNPVRFLINAGLILEYPTTLKLCQALDAKGIPYSVIESDPAFKGLAEGLSRCDCAIGCDSGPMHLASLLGLKTFVLFGPYSRAEFQPLFHTHGMEPRSEKKHLSDLTVEEVTPAVIEWLNRL